MVCRNEGKVLPSDLPNAMSSSQYYWTGYHIRRSNWIQIIGCFEETDVKRLTRETYSVYFPSAGLCQEVCLNSNALVFGLKSNVCACLKQTPSQESKRSSDCELSCDKEYSNETTIKFQYDCGGHGTYTLFKSGFYPESSQSQTLDCLSIQCGLRDKRFIERICSVIYNIVCNTTAYQYPGYWKEAVILCKAVSDSYLLGNVDLTDVDQACSVIQGQLNGPSWLGIAKETYISTDGVQDKISKFQSPRPERCLKCNRKNCVFADCSEHNNFMCLEKEKLIMTQINGRYPENSTRGHDKEYEPKQNATFKTTGKDSSSSLIAVPVCLTVLFLFIGAIVIVFFIRWKKNKDLQNKEQSPTNKFKYADNAEYSNVEKPAESNYCELQQPNAINSLANYSQLQLEGAHNNGYSDLPENNAASDNSANDIYDNM